MLVYVQGPPPTLIIHFTDVVSDDYDEGRNAIGCTSGGHVKASAYVLANSFTKVRLARKNEY